VKGLQPPNSLHLVAGHGWLELGDHVAAFEELEKIEPEPTEDEQKGVY